LTWSWWPAERVRQESQITITALPAPAGDETPALAELSVVVETPEQLRSGEIQQVSLTAELGEGEMRPKNADQAPQSFPDATLAINSRLDIPGMDVSPAGEFSQAMEPGRPAQFTWSLRARQAGSYSGTLWLYQAGLSDESQASGGRRLLLAQPVLFTAISLFGLGSTAAQVIGIVGSVVGLALLADLLLAAGRRWIMPKRQQDETS
jgi:hypothetical protein